MRYRPIMLLLGGITAIITVLMVVQALANHSPESHAVFNELVRGDDNKQSYANYVAQTYSYYFATTGPVPSSHGGVVMSIFMMLLAGLAGILVIFFDVQSSFQTFIEQAGFTRRQIYTARTWAFSGVLACLTIINVLVQFGVYLGHSPARYVGLSVNAALLILLYNVIWVAAFYLIGQILGTAFGRTWFALILVLVMGFTGAEALFGGGLPKMVTILDPGKYYWLALIIGAAIIAGADVLGLLLNHTLALENRSETFTGKSAQVVTFSVWALCVLIGFNIRYSMHGNVVVRAIWPDVELIIMGAIVWFGAEYLRKVFTSRRQTLN